MTRYPQHIVRDIVEGDGSESDGSEISCEGDGSESDEGLQNY